MLPDLTLQASTLWDRIIVTCARFKIYLQRSNASFLLPADFVRLGLVRRQLYNGVAILPIADVTPASRVCKRGSLAQLVTISELKPIYCLSETDCNRLLLRYTLCTLPHEIALDFIVWKRPRDSEPYECFYTVRSRNMLCWTYKLTTALETPQCS